MANNLGNPMVTSEETLKQMVKNTEQILEKYLPNNDAEDVADQLVPRIEELLRKADSQEEVEKTIEELAERQALRHISNHVQCWGDLLNRKEDRPSVFQEIFRSLDDPTERILIAVVGQGKSLQEVADNFHLDPLTARRAYLQALYSVRKELFRRSESLREKVG